MAWALDRRLVRADGSNVQSHELPESPVSVCPSWCESTHTEDYEHHLLPELATSGDASIDVVQEDDKDASPTVVLFWRGQTVVPHLTRETCADLIELLPRLTSDDLRDLTAVIKSAEEWFGHESDRILVDGP